MSNRRRLCPGCENESVLRRCLIQQITYAIEAGVDLVQIREADLPAADLAAIVAAIVALSRGSSSRVLVNDRLDVALACGADGVHLRADSAPAATVRAAVPAGFLLGRSVHGVEDARAAAPFVDYLTAGTVWPSESKSAGARLLGVAGLADIVRAVNVPVLAIGGVDLARMGELAAAGASGAAMIGLFLGSRNGTSTPCRAVSLVETVKQARTRFDASR